MPPVGLEPTISAGERPQTYVLYRAATGTGIFYDYDDDNNYYYIYIYIYINTKHSHDREPKIP
jgi:hypothetical protein